MKLMVNFEHGCKNNSRTEDFQTNATVALAFGLLSWGLLIVNNIIDLVVLFSCYHCEAALIQSVL